MFSYIPEKDFHHYSIFIYDPWNTIESGDIGCWSAHTKICSNIFFSFSKYVILWYNDIIHSSDTYQKVLFFKENLHDIPSRFR